MDTFNVVAGMATLLSLTINVFQWLWARRHRAEEFQELEATYSTLFAFADRCGSLIKNKSVASETKAEVKAILGGIDVLRTRVITLARRKFGAQPDLVPPWAHVGNYTFPEDRKDAKTAAT